MHDMAKEFGSRTITNGNTIVNTNTNTHTNSNSNSSDLPHNIPMIRAINKSSSAGAYGSHHNHYNNHNNQNDHNHHDRMTAFNFCQTSTPQPAHNVKLPKYHGFSTPNNLASMRNAQKSQQTLHCNCNNKNKHKNKDILQNNKRRSSHHYPGRYQLGDTLQTPTTEYFQNRNNNQNQFGGGGRHNIQHVNHHNNNTNSNNNNENTKYPGHSKYEQQINYDSMHTEAGVLDFSSAGQMMVVLVVDVVMQ